VAVSARVAVAVAVALAVAAVAVAVAAVEVTRAASRCDTTIPVAHRPLLPLVPLPG
jgi:hypothetical protein